MKWWTGPSVREVVWSGIMYMPFVHPVLKSNQVIQFKLIAGKLHIFKRLAKKMKHI